jgi:hypothetical protein
LVFSALAKKDNIQILFLEIAKILTSVKEQRRCESLMNFINGERDVLYGQIPNPEKLTPIDTLFRQRDYYFSIQELKTCCPFDQYEDDYS